MGERNYPVTIDIEVVHAESILKPKWPLTVERAILF